MGRKRNDRGRVRYNYMGMLAITMVVFVLLVGIMRQSNALELRLSSYEARAEELTRQIEDEKSRTKEIDKLKKHMETDEYAEEVAREKLGLVMDNEIVFQEEK